jgi:hypothetical protein
VQVAAVAREPPAMLQFMVAPEWVVDVGGGGMDVPGLLRKGCQEGEMVRVLGLWLVGWGELGMGRR